MTDELVGEVGRRRLVGDLPRVGQYVPAVAALTIDVAKLAGYLSGGYFTTKVVE